MSCAVVALMTETSAFVVMICASLQTIWNAVPKAIAVARPSDLQRLKGSSSNLSIRHMQERGCVGES